MTTMASSDTLLNTATPAQRLRQTAAAVRVAFTWWGTHKTLTALQREEVSSACAADIRFVTSGKRLVDVRHPAFRKLTSLRHRILAFWRSLTLPYVEPGIRLIPQAHISSFVEVMEGFREDLTRAEAELNREFAHIKEDVRQRLGRLYNPGNYPPETRGLFGVSWDWPSIEPPSYLLQLNPAIYHQEQERVARRFEQAVELAEQAFLAEFTRLINHLTERLSTGVDGERKVFRDSAVAKLVGFFERFRELKVSQDTQLEELIERAQQVVQGITPQALRDQDSVRQQVASQLAGVQAALDGLLVDRPRRNILRSQAPSGDV